MESIVLLIFALVVALSVFVQDRLLTTLEALNWHSGLIFITVALGAALIPVVVFAFAVAFFSRDRS
ncbi:MAG: hypothetical protein GX162_12155 [Firmicutes bacterium]|jgi:hypothetical protein|nr:hypothetical protein [Bacillota bacterium]